MLIYAAFAALILLGALLPFNFIPPLRRGPARNEFAHIAMPDPATTYPGYWICVYAQEIAEWWIAWAGALLIGLPVAWALSGTVLAPAAPLAALIAWRWRTTRVGERTIEYVGWGVEIAWGRRLGLARYNSDDINAANLRAGYPHLFADVGLTEDDVRAGLARWRWLARVVMVLVSLRVRRQSDAGDIA